MLPARAWTRSVASQSSRARVRRHPPASRRRRGASRHTGGGTPRRRWRPGELARRLGGSALGNAWSVGPLLVDASGFTHSTILPASSLASASTWSRCPSHGAAIMTTSDASAHDSLLAPRTPWPSSAAAASSRSTERDPAMTSTPPAPKRFAKPRPCGPASPIIPTIGPSVSPRSCIGSLIRGPPFALMAF